MSADLPTTSATSGSPEPEAGASAGLTPGQAFASRYRVISLLGRGGMGEVYRVDDLKLGQQAALKLLPERLASHADRLSSFHAEVRLSREVTHLNVCRVYDIGEDAGRHYLTMEYVDGEDLASLLKRIGRLPTEKALEIGHQICAGLAAAHARGVLHRDLKPANVMLDGRGQVRIMDFGLAIRAGESGDGLVAGTPSYMAPEQFTGTGLSTRTDLYALGLILYELFTGKRPFEAATLDEWSDRHRTTPVGPPSALVNDLPAEVEAAILRCLEKDPFARPASALAVAAALPGGDPLAAALAAGETPSPQLVAAAGESGELRPRTVLALGAATALLLTIALLAGARANLLHTVPLVKSPDVLDERARGIARDAGYPAAPAYEAGFVGIDFEARRALAKHLATGGDAAIGRSFASPVYYVYRGALDPLEPRWFRDPKSPAIRWLEEVPGRVGREDPPVELPGMVSVELAPDGRLLDFRGIPSDAALARSGAAAADFASLFSAAGLDPARLVSAPPPRPRVASDASFAWEAAGDGISRIRVEAASLRGVPVDFRVVPLATPSTPSPTLAAVGTRVLLAVCGILGLAGAVLARYNVRRGRGDRSGALRLAALVFGGYFLQWILGASHVATTREIDLATQGASRAVYLAFFAWLQYLALEPFVRRRWPEMLISWTRVLAGRFGDPRVGRDVVLGILCGAAASSVFSGLALASPALGWGPWLRAFDPHAFPGAREAASTLLGRSLSEILYVLGAAFFLVLLRMVFRNAPLAAATLVALMSMGAIGGLVPYFIGFVVMYSIATLLMLRVGLLAALAMMTCEGLIDDAAAAIASPAWAAAAWAIPLGALAVLVCLGLRAALGSGSLLRALDD
jgi:serine/threonine-protein kinase